jgi:D-aminopeptidase
LPADSGGFTVGALVSTNFGARPDLTIAGVPIGREIIDLMPEEHPEGSCVVVLATDAPLLPHQLHRLALRAGTALARAGSIGANGSGELMLAFSTAQTVPPRVPGLRASSPSPAGRHVLAPPQPVRPLFTATIEAVEEAVANALFAATTTRGRDGNILYALPVDRALEVLDRYGRLARRP